MRWRCSHLVVMALLLSGLMGPSRAVTSTSGTDADEAELPPSCSISPRRGAAYSNGWRFVEAAGPREVEGRFGRLSWKGSVLEVQVREGFAVEFCVGTEEGGLEFSVNGGVRGPRTHQERSIGPDRIEQVGYGVIVGPVPWAVDSGR
jgi:hypothetical protein